MNNYAFVLMVWLGVQTGHLLNNPYYYTEPRTALASSVSLVLVLIGALIYTKGKAWVTTNRKQHKKRIQPK